MKVGDSFSWIRTVLMSHPDWRGGIDLDQDGAIGPQEQIQDTNQNGLIGDPGDWERFVVSNADALRNRVAFFGWAKPFKNDNPIHELMAIESEIATAEEIRGAYTFAAQVSRIVRERLADGTDRSNLEKVQLIYSVMKEMGVRFIDQEDSLLATNVRDKVFDCDTSSFIVLAVAHEMGWPVFAVRAPEHLFVRWEGEGERFNVDFGKSDSDDDYISGAYGGRKISPQAISSGVYLTSLTPEQLRACFFENRGIMKGMKEKLGRYEAAIADFNEAIRLDPDNASSHYHRGECKRVLHWHEEAIADYDQAIRLDPNNAAAYNNRGVSKRWLRRDEEADSDFETARRLGGR